MKRKSIITWMGIISLWCNTAMAQNPAIIQYVNTYKFIAIKEMQRTGIPASIKLAQGILETEAGNSDLVKKSNNHFGIKCKSSWTGDKVYHDDDERGECFRSYPSAEDSYRDHSDFLKNSPRYAFLFSLNPEDYEGWAAGLKKAGYATNPKYTQIVIKYIEDYNLQLYSLIALGKRSLSDESPMYAVNSNADSPGMNAISTTAAGRNTTNTIAAQQTPSKRANYPQEEFKINDTRVLFALTGASLLAIADQYGIKYNHVLEFNELTESDDILKNDQLVFLQRKRKQGATEFHIVQKGETLYDIAQMEGVRMESLVSYNPEENDRPLVEGQKIYLQKSAAKSAVSSDEKPVTSEPVQVASSTPVNNTTVKHIVLGKETLYSIAKKYEVGIDQIKTWNSLQKSDIKTGQELMIYKN
ncbi:MAG: glucosaminidase domain-containing protein [Agriterribacter sp.]